MWPKGKSGVAFFSNVFRMILLFLRIVMGLTSFLEACVIRIDTNETR